MNTDSIMKGTVFLLLVQLSLYSVCDCVLLGKEEDQFLKQVLREFEIDPENGMYDRLIESPYARCMLIPKLFIWCPLRHNGLTVQCPIHGCPLQAGHWMDVLDGSSATPRNPRLIYDLGGNVILVQCFISASTA